MSDGVKDMVALLQVIADKRVTDEKFAATFERITELLTEASTALAEVVEASQAKPEQAAAAAPVDIEALSKSLVAALVVALKNMPAPVVKLAAPEAAPQQEPWRSLKLKRDADGFVLTRVS